MRFVWSLLVAALALDSLEAVAQPAAPPSSAWPDGVDPGQPWQPALQAGPVYALPPPPSAYPLTSDPNADVARLDRLLRHRADHGRMFGIATGIAGLAIGAVCIPTGVYMINKNQQDPVPGTILTGVGIGTATIGIFSFFFSSGDLDSLGRSLEDKEEGGEPAPEVVLEIEHAWREKAESTHSTRRTVGILGIVGGILVMGVGAGFAIADPVGGLSQSEQQTLGALLVSGGAVNTLGGFGSLFLETEVESTWETYQSFKGPNAGLTPPMPMPAPTFGVAPTRGGAMVVSGVRF